MPLKGDLVMAKRMRSSSGQKLMADKMNRRKPKDIS